MEPITNKSELLENIERLARYLQNPGNDRKEALALIRRGKCFVVTERDSKLFFAPSRFIGYRDNSLREHAQNKSKDGRDTNEVLIELLSAKPEPSGALDREFAKFCASFGAGPFNKERKFWDLR